MPAAPEYHSDVLITIAVTATSSLSAFFCALILLSYAKFPSLRRHPASLVLARCVADLLFCLGTFFSHITPASTCEAWSFLTQFFAVAAELYTLAQALDLLLSVGNPFGSYIRHLRTYHACVWGASALSAALLLGLREAGKPFFGRDPYVGVCWIRRLDPDEGGLLADALGPGRNVFIFFVAPLVLTYAASGAFLLVAMWRLSRGLPETLEARKAMFRSTRDFIAGFMVYWVGMFATYGAVTETGKSSAEGVLEERLSIVLALALGSRGLVTGVVYFLTYGFDVLRLLCHCGAQQRGLIKEGLLELSREPRLARELRTETLYYVTRGIVRAVLQAARSPAVNEHSRPRSVGKPAVAFNRFPLSRRHEERGLFSQQRRGPSGRAAAAVVFEDGDAGAGGGDGLQEPLVGGINAGSGGEGGGPRRTSYMQRERDIRGRPSMLSMTEEEEAAEELFMAGDSLGCCGGCLSATRKDSSLGEDNEISTSHTANLLYSLLFPSSYVSAHFIFTDLEPHLFSRLRALNGVAEDVYMEAIATARREQPTEGASGAFLYFSSCERFIVKTLSPTEKNVLIDIMPHFEAHLEAHPDTLITRFLGCYALTMYGSSQYFCVMKNVLTSEGATIHERYDLKGSWIHRRHKPPAVGQRVACRFCGQDFRVGARRSSNQCPARPNHQHEPTTILLDSDWDYKLRLARPQARALVAAVIADTEWLRDQGIMDYSLLLGIHRSRYNLAGLAVPGGGLARAASQLFEAGAAPGAPAPALSVPRRAAPLSIRAPAAEHRGWGGGPSSLGSPTLGRMSSSLVGSVPQSFSSSLALSVDAGGEGTPRSAAEGAPPATAVPPPIASEGVLADELDSGDGPLFVEVEEAPHPAAAPAAAPPAPPSLFHEHRGGMRAVVVEGPGIYYLGMIDVLQRWTFEKRLENWFKTRVLLQDVSGLSAVPPKLYAARFKARVLAQLIEGCEEGELDRL